MAISTDDQQFCLRWNNFQANITSQFETLRDDQDFTDVTIACEGQRLQAHKVVLSACSPFFKELFKSNPCSHPIIFMRDVEVRHIIALMEFMYAGEVNVAQAHLPAFLKTAESLKIRGLTETTTPDPEQSRRAKKSSLITSSSSSTVTSSQDIADGLVSPPAKRQCKSESDPTTINLNSFELQTDNKNQLELDPKVELPDYMSDDDDVDDNNKDENNISNFFVATDVSEITAGMEIVPQTSSSNFNLKETSQDGPIQGVRLRRRRSSDHWLPFDNQTNSVEDNDIATRFSEQEGDRRNRLIKLGEGIEIYEDQLRSVKWSDYRKLTRGLATILFSPAELATCSVTGQRWSRAGSGERPVKPALDRAKVQAIISYVATRFPMVEISRIKQVLAYKCKENSTAFKMKAVRYYGEQLAK